MAKNKRNYLFDEDNDKEEYLDENDNQYYITPKRKDRERTKKILMVGFAAAAVCLIVIAWVIAATLIDKYTPNSNVISLYDYYNVDKEADESEAILFMNGEIQEDKAFLFDDIWYFSKEFVDENLNERFYYDEKNNELIYTTPSKIMTIPFDSQTYYVAENAKRESYIIAKKIDDSIYIAIDFVKDKADFLYELRTEPKRLLVVTQYNTTEYVSVSENASIRTGKGIKFPILSIGRGNYNWKIYEYGEDWTCLVTDDAQKGYVRTKELEETYKVTLSNNFQAPLYTSVSKPYKINMVWHAVYNMIDNDDIYTLLDSTKGVNTISPTWYQLAGSDGSFNSFASQSYVDYIHEMGMEIWPLISDFTSVDVEKGWSEYELFSNTLTRRKLIASIVNEIVTYGYDGINIDFEKIDKDTGIHYVQFLRELSIECRRLGVVLSIDNYVPMPHSKHYDRHEQGIVADYVIVMGYDEHYNGQGEAGSIASLDFVRNGIVNTIAEVPADKVINALPFYTRLWEEYTDESGQNVVYGKAYTMTGAQKKIEELSINLLWSENLGQYVGECDIDDVHYSIWMEDARSIEEKMKIVKENGIAGVAGWSLGGEFEEVWDVIAKYIAPVVSKDDN